MSRYKNCITVKHSQYPGQEQHDIDESKNSFFNKLIFGPHNLTSHEKERAIDLLLKSPPEITRGMEETTTDRACNAIGFPPPICKTAQKLNNHQQISPYEKREITQFCYERGIPCTNRGLGTWLKGLFGGNKKTTTPVAPPPKPTLQPGEYDIGDIRRKIQDGKATEAEQRIYIDWETKAGPCQNMIFDGVRHKI